MITYLTLFTSFLTMSFLVFLSLFSLENTYQVMWIRGFSLVGMMLSSIAIEILKTFQYFSSNINNNQPKNIHRTFPKTQVKLNLRMTTRCFPPGRRTKSKKINITKKSGINFMRVPVCAMEVYAEAAQVHHPSKKFSTKKLLPTIKEEKISSTKTTTKKLLPRRSSPRLAAKGNNNLGSLYKPNGCRYSARISKLG